MCKINAFDSLITNHAREKIRYLWGKEHQGEVELYKGWVKK